MTRTIVLVAMVLGWACDSGKQAAAPPIAKPPGTL